MATIRDFGWYWTLTASLSAVGLSGRPIGLWSAVVLSAIQLVHVIGVTHDFAAFPVQVRAAYPAMLMADLWEPLQWIHRLQLAGTSARVLTGYCVLARTPSLTPLNRRQPLTLALVRRTYLSPEAATQPCGAVFQSLSRERVRG